MIILKMTKGVYVLVLEVLKNIRVRVGALGLIDFEKGCYAYIGSAQNSIEARVGRHFRKEKKLRWHIDSLLSHKHVKLIKALCKECDNKDEECKLALSLIGDNPDFVKGFGCSDCKCKSHLVKVSSLKFDGLNVFKKESD